MMAVPLDQSRRSALGVAKEILRQDGARGFLRGLAPVLLRAFPVNASALFVYEGTMRILGAEKVNADLLWFAAELSFISTDTRLNRPCHYRSSFE